MKKYLLIISCIVSLNSFAAGGIWQSYIILSINSTNTTYMGALGGSSTPSLNNANLGTITALDGLKISGSGTKTFKNSGTNVCSARLNYRVYKQGSSAPSFTVVNLPFATNIGGGGDQEWANLSLNAIFPTVFTSTGTYVFEAYWDATLDNCMGTPNTFDSNNSSNYRATFNYTGPLPVSLLNFSGKSANKTSVLEWKTADEVTNSHFDIERSWDAKSFERIGSVLGKGTFSGETTYTFTDNSPKFGMNYYRLKQVDFDGKFTYSRIVSTIVRTNGEIALFPNPTIEKLTVSGLENEAFLEIVDSQGKKIWQKSLTNTPEFSVPIRGWAAGTYFLQVTEALGNRSYKFVVK